MKKLIFAGIILVALALMVLPAAAADPHNGNTGQPDQSCQLFFGNSGPFVPFGFNTAGFNFATTRYAGSGFTANGNNPMAVSQYDVACFEQFMRLGL